MGRKRAQEERTRFRYRRALYQGRTVARSSRLRWVLFAAAFLLVAANLLFGDGGVLRGNRLAAELGHLHAQNVEMRRDLARLRTEMDLSEDDPLSIERIVRERYGMARKDEIVFWFEDDGVVPQIPEDPAPEAPPEP